MYILLSPTSPPDVHITGVFHTVKAAEHHLRKTIKKWQSLNVFRWQPGKEPTSYKREWPVRVDTDTIGIDMEGAKVSMRAHRFDPRAFEVMPAVRSFRDGIGLQPKSVHVFAAIINKEYAYRFTLDYLVEF